MSRPLSFFLLMALVSATSGNNPYAAQSKPAVKLVSLGEIASINLHKRSFELKSEKDQATDSGGVWSDGTAGRGGRLRGSIWIGMGTGQRDDIDGRRGRGGVDASRSGQPSDLPSPGEADDGLDSAVRTSVQTSAETLFSDGDRPMFLEDLRVGDYVEVTGTLKAKSDRDMDANKVVRKPRPAGESPAR